MERSAKRELSSSKIIQLKYDKCSDQQQPEQFYQFYVTVPNSLERTSSIRVTSLGKTSEGGFY
jgi:hypothetical protein